MTSAIPIYTVLPYCVILYVSQHHFRLYDIHKGRRRDVAAVQFPQPPGPPGGTDGLQGALVVELVLPAVCQVDCICLLTILSSLQTLDERVLALSHNIVDINNYTAIPSYMLPLLPALS